MDDGIHFTAHNMNVASANVVLGRNGSILYSAWMRFLSVAIPVGATIDVAYITWVAAASESSAIASDIYFHDADNSGQITDDASWHAIVDSNLTLASVPYDLDASDPWISGIAYDTPSIVVPLQEVIDRPGWATGQDLQVIVISDLVESASFRRPAAEDHASYAAPLLHVEYTEAAPGSVASASGLAVVLGVSADIDISPFTATVGLQALLNANPEISPSLNAQSRATAVLNANVEVH